MSSGFILDPPVSVSVGLLQSKANFLGVDWLISTIARSHDRLCSLNRRLLYWLEVKCAAVMQIFPLVVMSVTFSPTLFSFSFSVSFAYFTLKKVKVWVTQSCPTLCNPMDCSPPGSFVHGILQTRTLEWVAISFSRGSSQPRDWTHVSCVSCTSRQTLYH